MKVGEGIQFPAETDPNEVGIPRNSPHAGRAIGETPPPPNGAGQAGWNVGGEYSSCPHAVGSPHGLWHSKFP